MFFTGSAGVSQTDIRTDGQTDGNAIVIMAHLPVTMRSVT